MSLFKMKIFEITFQFATISTQNFDKLQFNPELKNNQAFLGKILKHVSINFLSSLNTSTQILKFFINFPVVNFALCMSCLTKLKIKISTVDAFHHYSQTIYFKLKFYLVV